MLQTVLQYLDEKHVCPHCQTELTLCHSPSIHVGDGLGWGSEYLFICLNNECSLFVKGWDHIEHQYGHVGSYRHMELPNSKESFSMMVGGYDAFTGSIVDVDDLRRQDVRYQELQKALQQLDECLAKKDIKPVLTVLLNDSARLDDRKRAVMLLVPFNDLNCVELLRNHIFKDEHLGYEVKRALDTILHKHFLKECPYCAELVKLRAVVCKHCQRELSS